MYLFCFQSKKIVSNVLFFVSNLKRLFPMYFFCFQSKKIVSNLTICFQSNLFPMYVSNLHITNPVKISEIGKSQIQVQIKIGFYLSDLKVSDLYGWITNYMGYSIGAQADYKLYFTQFCIFCDRYLGIPMCYKRVI